MPHQDPNLQQIIALLKRQTASTFGTAARKASRSFTGSSTSGAFAGRQGDIFAQRGAAISGATASLIPQLAALRLSRERFEEQKRQSKQAGTLSGLAGIGRGVGTALSFVPGLQPIGAGIAAASGATSLLGRGAGGGAAQAIRGASQGVDLQQILQQIIQANPDIDPNVIAEILGLRKAA